MGQTQHRREPPNEATPKAARKPRRMCTKKMQEKTLASHRARRGRRCARWRRACHPARRRGAARPLEPAGGAACAGAARRGGSPRPRRRAGRRGRRDAGQPTVKPASLGNMALPPPTTRPTHHTQAPDSYDPPRLSGSRGLARLGLARVQWEPITKHQVHIRDGTDPKTRSFGMIPRFREFAQPVTRGSEAPADPRQGVLPGGS